jgi:uncharacterized protein with beta-barrel porin domain
MIAGMGTIGTLRSAGRVAPGAWAANGQPFIGRLEMAGDVAFDAGATFVVDVASDGRADLLAATGTVRIAATGTTLAVTPEAATGAFRDAGACMVISAEGGLMGRFATLEDGVPDIRFRQETEDVAPRIVASPESQPPETRAASSERDARGRGPIVQGGGGSQCVRRHNDRDHLEPACVGADRACGR